MLLNKPDRIDDASSRNSMGLREILSEMSLELEATCSRSFKSKICTFSLHNSLTRARRSAQFVRVMIAEVQNSSALSNVVIIQRLLCSGSSQLNTLVFFIYWPYRAQRIHVHQLWSRQMLMVNWDIARRRLFIGATRTDRVIACVAWNFRRMLW